MLEHGWQICEDMSEMKVVSRLRQTQYIRFCPYLVLSLKKKMVSYFTLWLVPWLVVQGICFGLWPQIKFLFSLRSPRSPRLVKCFASPGLCLFQVLPDLVLVQIRESVRCDFPCCLLLNVLALTCFSLPDSGFWVSIVRSFFFSPQNHIKHFCFDYFILWSRSDMWWGYKKKILL